MGMLVKSTSIGVMAVFVLAAMSAVDAEVGFYIFGDSMYDNGMTLYNGVKGAGAQFWPYGETYFKKPAGRYSDGLLIPDFVAEYAGLPFPKPYLLPGLNSYTNGINFASAGACVLVETRPRTINIKMQVDYFRQMVQKMKQQLGEAQATKTIYNEGGRKFAFQNIGPLGCMPSVKFMLGFQGTCAQEPLSLAKMHNANFLAVVKKLQAQLPGFKYTVYDFYTSLYLRVLYGSRYGFQDSQTACCGSGAFNGDFTCQKKGENFTVCSNPSSYLWFDAGHPTQKADAQFAREFWTGNANIVSPYNLKWLFSN
ncbi:hypothetical protein Cgig2_025212 [Carnegiea gigantea]|uniref:Uncharacterized protein n=1 Tax=Carnegiea gigantea TaxID=171969 RepID=A0A9Q1QMM0_9CARY|nr:hypothetical protein Cgig2_025212 [Carnegiea gigantea]